MIFKKCAVAICLAVSLPSAAMAAQPAVIDFNLPAGVPFLGSAYSQDGFTFTNSRGGTDAYGNWIALNVPGFNADGASADIFQNYGGTSNSITQDSGLPFSFRSIGLADVFNGARGGDVRFTFNYAGGRSSVQTVSLADGIAGLQNFSFNQSGLSSVQFQPLTTIGPWIQFDNVGVDGFAAAAPEPAAWGMMILGLGVVGYALRRRQLALRGKFAAA